MAFNEEKTRFHLIDPVLRKKGYDDPQRIRLETPAPVEPTGPKGRRSKHGGRTDYLLCVQVGDMPKPLPVAVLEAKRESEDPLAGMEQAKGYADCTRFDVQYVFASNGHLYGEYDKPSGIQTGPHPLSDFPPHPDLCTRYAQDKGIDLNSPEAALLFQADSPAWSASRYYQDAAIRTAFEKIILERQAGNAARVLLTLATGAGKTIIATNLLWRMAQAGLLPKPALFLCDRDELREQAYTKLKAAFGGNARIVETVRGQNAAANARIHIATYQTLGIDENGDGSFLTDHYGEDAFSVIIIDECHRSAWGKWSQVLTRNPNAIHIGLTATPRKLKAPKHDKKSKDVEAAIAADDAITAHNVEYFGEPVYEYTLADEENAGKPFPSYARTLQHRDQAEGSSRYFWTVDFAARRAKAREEMQPLLDKAAGIKAAVVDLKERLKQLKKDKAGESEMEALEADIREKEKAARDLEADAAAIDAAVFDLKAVNPNAVAVVDERTPGEIIESITAQGRIVTDALARLNQLMAAPEVPA